MLKSTGSTCEAKGVYSAAAEVRDIQSTADWPSCALKCRELSDCTHWGFDGYKCYLKGGILTSSNLSPSPQWITGYKDCTPGKFIFFVD